MRIFTTLLVMTLPSRQVLRPLLAAHRDLRIEAEVGTLREARLVLSMLKFDLVLLETSMPGEDGFELLPAVEPTTRVICLANDAADMMRALSFGSLDCVALPARASALTEVLERVRNSETPSTFHPFQLHEQSSFLR